MAVYRNLENNKNSEKYRFLTNNKHCRQKKHDSLSLQQLVTKKTAILNYAGEA